MLLLIVILFPVLWETHVLLLIQEVVIVFPY